ncbi:uncharacterized protein LOC125676804 [Ostrea edulis]|uniref:uncharacterized protein LOC125676804 n=1 Tax=Ostrea edulis TaxID=37623 RepID=UPI0024AF2A99|nr:uncharacterized protein LOC125676804 [Ostrea edulis]
MVHGLCFQIVFLAIAAHCTLGREVEATNGQLFCVYTKDAFPEKIFDKKFDNTTEMCCNKSGTYNRYDNQGRRLECCGNGTYNPEIEICCADQVHDKKSMCCGNKVYNKDDVNNTEHLQKDECCGIQVFSSHSERRRYCNDGIKNASERSNGRNPSRKGNKRKPSLSFLFSWSGRKWKRKYPLFLINIILGNADVSIGKPPRRLRF